MNTSTISAALNSAPPSAKQTSGAASAETDDANPRFSDVLKGQNASVKTDTNTSSASTSTTAPLKKGHPSASDKPEPTSDAIDPTALLAGPQGATVPELTLNIAAQAASSSIARNSNQQSANGNRDNALLSATGILAPATGQSNAAQAANAPAASDDHAATPSSDTQTLKPLLAPALNEAPRQQQDKAGKTAALLNAKQTDKSTQAGLDSRTGSAGNQTLVAAPPTATVALVQANPRRLDASDRATRVDISSAANLSALNPGSTPMASAPAQASATPTNLGIATPLQSGQWGNDFGRQFVALTRMGGGAMHTAELRLNPPDLGPLRISLKLSDNVAQANFISPHAAVRQAVENALPQLQQQLANAGISLGQTSVSDQSQGQNAFDESPSGKRQPSSHAIGVIGSTDGESMAHPAPRGKILDGLVNTFV